MIPFPAEQLTNLHRLAPEIVLCVFGIVIMIADPFLQAPANARPRMARVYRHPRRAVSVRLMATRSRYGLQRPDSAPILSAFSSIVIVIVAAALAILGSHAVSRRRKASSAANITR